MPINGFIAKVRCICGHVMLVDGPTECPKCKSKLEVRVYKKGRAQPWAIAPDGYDLTQRKYNKPEIIGWKEA